VRGSRKPEASMAPPSLRGQKSGVGEGVKGTERVGAVAAPMQWWMVFSRVMAEK